MAYIDPDGMFGGDRMAMLTDRARFFWPWIWVASNTMGRIELNHRKICSTAFRQFKHRPTEEQFWALIKEFRDCYLLFVYKDEIGRVWGQWDVTEKYLPNYKIKADAATPEPIARHWIDWKKKYLEIKAEALTGKSCGISLFENLENIPEDLEKFAIGEERRDLGKEKPSCAKSATEADPQVSAVASASSVSLSLMDGPLDGPLDGPKPRQRGRSAKNTSAFDGWYAVYWRHVGRINALAAFNRRMKQLVETGLTENQSVAFLTHEAVEDRKRFELTQDWDWRQNLHPATWLNGERWKDEPRQQTVTVRQNLSATQRAKLLWNERNGKRADGVPDGSASQIPAVR